MYYNLFSHKFDCSCSCSYFFENDVIYDCRAFSLVQVYDALIYGIHSWFMVDLRGACT